MPKLAIEPPTAEAPAVGVVARAPDRFARVGRMWVDLAAVVAIELRDSGGGLLHLTGGQAVELPAAGAAGVLKRLGVSARRGRRSEVGGQEKATKKPRAPRGKGRPRVKPAAVAKGLLPAIAGLFSKAS